MSRIIVAYAPAGAGKSSFAQSTINPIWYAELDPGSFERSRKSKLVQLHQYDLPMTSLEDFGFVDLSMKANSEKGAAQIVHEYHGWTEVFVGQFVKDYLAWLKDPSTPNGVIDTYSILTEMVINNFRQRVQEARRRDPKMSNDASDRLNRLEYEEVNTQHGQLLQGAKRQGKTLVCVCHQGDRWENGVNTNTPKPDGWKGLEGAADVVLRFRIENKQPVAYIDKAGGCHLAMLGMKLVAPTLDYVNQLIDSAAYLNDREVDLPATPDDIIETAEVQRMLS